jgi:hypothetical protein
MSDVEKENQLLMVSQVMATRQTILPKRLIEPGPSVVEIDKLFLAASTAPDHDLINPCPRQGETLALADGVDRGCGQRRPRD